MEDTKGRPSAPKFGRDLESQVGASADDHTGAVSSHLQSCASQRQSNDCEYKSCEPSQQQRAPDSRPSVKEPCGELAKSAPKPSKGEWPQGSAGKQSTKSRFEPDNTDNVNPPLAGGLSRQSDPQQLGGSPQLRPEGKIAESTEAVLTHPSSSKEGTNGKGVAAFIFGRQLACPGSESKEASPPAIAFLTGKMSDHSSSASRAMTASSADGSKPLPCSKSQQEEPHPPRASSIQGWSLFKRTNRVCSVSHDCKSPLRNFLRWPETSFLT